MDTSGQFKELIDTLEDLTETVKHVGIIACDFEEQSQVPLILLYCLLSYIIYWIYYNILKFIQLNLRIWWNRLRFKSLRIRLRLLN